MEALIENPRVQVTIPKIEMPVEILESIQEPMKILSEKYNIGRARRCYLSLIYYLSSGEGLKVRIEYYDLYIMAALIIYSKIYGDGNLTYTEAMKT